MSGAPNPHLPQPSRLPFNPAGIPESLMGCPFVCVRDEWKEDLNKGKGGWSKVPKNPITGSNASPSDLSTGSDFTKALNAFRDRSRNYDGVGILRTPGRLFVDIDGVLDPETGEIDSSSPVAEIARELLGIAVAYGAYIERSPGGRGIHVIFKFYGELPDRGCVKKGQGREHCEIALYDHNRYFDLTGITCAAAAPQRKMQPRQSSVSTISGFRLMLPLPAKANPPIPISPCTLATTRYWRRLFAPRTAIRCAACSLWGTSQATIAPARRMPAQPNCSPSGPKTLRK